MAGKPHPTAKPLWGARPCSRPAEGRARRLARLDPAALPLGTAAVQLSGLAACGHRAGAVGRAGWGSGCVCRVAPSLPAALAGPAKWPWSRAQVPTCLLTGLLFEKLKRCQDNLTSTLLSGGWSRPGGGLFVQGGLREGTEQIIRRVLSSQHLGGGRGKQNRTLRPGLTLHSCWTRHWPSACPGPTVCRVLGEAAGTRVTSLGGPGTGRRKPFQLLLRSEFKKKNELLG